MGGLNFRDRISTSSIQEVSNFAIIIIVILGLDIAIMSDGGVDNKQSVRLQQIHHLKELVHNLEKVAISSKNENHIAGEILAEHKNISNYLDKMKQSAESWGNAIGHDLLNFLNIPSDMPIKDYWNYFCDELKALEGTSEEFRRKCLSIAQAENDSTIMHRVCSKNPPVLVVKTLLELIPFASETDKKQFNHLALNKDRHYPIQQIRGYVPFTTNYTTRGIIRSSEAVS